MFRLFAIAMLALGGWLGLKTERLLHDARCREAGGVVGDSGICLGVPAR